ncbi:MAG: cation transporter [Nocardioides sp.]|uniref:cation diffusion facilitator family transporter n=1 Tax=Nocardioides sp. TaxID=35761 RepID=UPI0039E5CF76
MSAMTIHVGTPLGPRRTATLVRRVRLLVVFTIGYNVVEGVVALLAGSSAGSSALLGFGLDSVIEVSSAAAVAWQFSGTDHESRERIALKVIGLSFFGLAAFLAYDAASTLARSHEPGHSTVGIVIAALSLVVMPAASLAQRRAGQELGSHSAVADSKQTLLCTYMSGVLLVGLVLNSMLGWWWADPLAALAISCLAVREGLAAWSGDACCSPAEALFTTGPADGDACGCGEGCR